MNASPDFDMVLFGGTGDLVMRKLLPALYHARRAGLLAKSGRILALGRQTLTREAYLELASGLVRPHLDPDSDEAWQDFAATLDYLRLDATAPDDYPALARRIGHDPAWVVVCYLATAPALFSTICAQLARVGLNREQVRVVLEKPLGHDLASSNAINEAVAQYFNEEQLYRIDHYLGKESVQNLLALRFGNVLFEPLWRREWVQSVQITIAEELGVEGRGEFYDRTGALRDMLQNHLLQLLCMVAMEPPASLDADAIRGEKLKLLKALRPFGPGDVAAKTVRGQYGAGAVAGQLVAGYQSEEGIAPHSHTETFVALKAEIDNWRWAGVPFFLRTGKRMPARVAEIVMTFHDVPHKLFPMAPSCRSGNRLVIELQPEESVRLWFQAKEPGDGMNLQPVCLNLDFHETFRVRRVDAYERLLLDVIRGRLALFMRREELVEAWRWVEPILDAWQQGKALPRPYPAGTWGPPAASALPARDGVTWHEEC